jgi:hypothetical protein
MRLTGAASAWNVSAGEKFTPIERRSGDLPPACNPAYFGGRDEQGADRCPRNGAVAVGTIPPFALRRQHAPAELAPVNPKLNLTLEQRHTIREIVKDKKADAASADVQATVGEPVPKASPAPMPSDVARKVLQVKAHSYFLAQQIVIVDPRTTRWPR